jgi:hypothetical protein
MVEVRRCGPASEPHVRTSLHSRGATSTPSSDKEQEIWNLGASSSELPRIQICPMACMALELDGRLCLWM